MSDTNGAEPRILTTEERVAALVTNRSGAAQTEETKQLMAGATMFKPGDYYDRNRANLAHRAMTNGFRAHVRKAVVDDQPGYVVWWERKEPSDV